MSIPGFPSINYISSRCWSILVNTFDFSHRRNCQVLADTSRHLSPTVLTVFSAPNYCDRYQNKAAVLYIDEGGFYIVNLLRALFGHRSIVLDVFTVDGCS